VKGALEVVGKIVKPHGIKGALIARPSADGSDVLLHVATVTLEHHGRREPRQVRTAQWQGKQILLALDGVPDRTAAEALVGASLLISADELPEPDEGEYYRTDLIGLDVVRPNGEKVGRVVELETSPMQEWLVVDVGGRTVLVPFTEPLIEVDLEGKRIVVDAPEGLFDPE
jgi:16S rRNA processing protein RimM